MIDTAPDDRRRAALLHEKGDILHTAGDPQAARTLYEEALKYDGDNWVTLNNLAYLLSDDLNEAQAALPYARRAVALVDSASALDTLGWIYVGLGDYTTAIAELSRALRHDPDAALTLYHLGEAYRRNAQFTEAIDVLESARAPARIQGNDELLRDIERAIERSETRQDRP